MGFHRGSTRRKSAVLSGAQEGTYPCRYRCCFMKKPGAPVPAGFPFSVPGREGGGRHDLFSRRQRQGFSRQDGSCATQLPPARGKPLWTPSCSALRFSHEKTREESCQCFRQWIQKKGRECRNTPRPAGQSPDGIIASARHDQVFAPARVRTSCRGRLLSTFHQVDKQSHDNAGHDLRGNVQQELLHMGILLYRRAAPRIL